MTGTLIPILFVYQEEIIAYKIADESHWRIRGFLDDTFLQHTSDDLVYKSCLNEIQFGWLVHFL